MSLTMLLNRPCVLIQRVASGDRDEFGNDLPGETFVSTVCELQQTRRDELGADELGVTTWLLILPAGTDVDLTDSIMVDGALYELVGEPWAARNPRTGVDSHVEATVKRTAGEGVGS